MHARGLAKIPCSWENDLNNKSKFHFAVRVYAKCKSLGNIKIAMCVKGCMPRIQRKFSELLDARFTCVHMRRRPSPQTENSSLSFLDFTTLSDSLRLYCRTTVQVLCKLRPESRKRISSFLKRRFSQVSRSLLWRFVFCRFFSEI